MCTVPPGVGAIVDLAVLTSAPFRAGGQGFFRYDSPVLTSIVGNYLLVGQQSRQFVLSGSNLGVNGIPNGIPTVSIAGIACTSVLVLNSSTVACTAWDRMTSGGYSTNAVVLSVGLVSSRSTEILSVLGRP